MARRNQQQSNDSGIFQKIGLLSDLTNAMTNKELKEAFENLGNNGDRLYEIFAEAVYNEIEYLMKGEREEEVPQVMADAAQSAQQVYAAMHSLYSMMVSLSNTPAMAPLNLIAERMTGQTFNPQYAQAYQAPQYAPPQQPQYEQPTTAGYPAHPHTRRPPQQPAPEPVYEEPAPQPAPRPAPRQQPRQQAPQQPAAQAPAPAPQKRRQYGEQPPPQPGQPAARPGPAQTNRPAPRQGHTDPAPTLPPRRNSIAGLY